MDEHAVTTHTGGHAAHGAAVHEESSVWPVLTAIAAIAAGLALVWLSKDPGSSFAGPMAGAGLAAVFACAAGWIWEKHEQGKEAAEGFDAAGPDPRYTQVISFLVAEGQAEAARGDEGVISALKSASLAGIHGFEDLRVTAAASASGPSQVLVETTWQDRDAFEAYDATRGPLDIITNHDAQVVPGSVQAFDMEVVRDTKRHAYRFGLGAGAAIVGGLLAGGFAFGAAQTLFEDAPVVVSDGGNGGPVADPYAVEARDNKFAVSTLEAPPNTEVTFTLTNNGANPHNLAFYDAKGGTELAAGSTGAILTAGGTEGITFTTPGPGTYYFQCDVHPDQMNGTFTVREGAPPPGGATNGGSTPTGTVEVKATDNKFDTKTIEAKAGAEFTVNFVNDGKNPHNLEFLDKKGGKELAPGATGEILTAGKSETITFTPPGPGTYYFQCIVHPNDMFGDFIVK